MMYALSMELEMHRRSKGPLIIRDLRSPGFNKSEMKNYNSPPRFGDYRSARVPSPQYKWCRCPDLDTPEDKQEPKKPGREGRAERKYENRRQLLV